MLRSPLTVRLRGQQILVKPCLRYSALRKRKETWTRYQHETNFEHPPRKTKHIQEKFFELALRIVGRMGSTTRCAMHSSWFRHTTLEFVFKLVLHGSNGNSSYESRFPYRLPRKKNISGGSKNCVNWKTPPTENHQLISLQYRKNCNIQIESCLAAFSNMIKTQTTKNILSLLHDRGLQISHELILWKNFRQNDFFVQHFDALSRNLSLESHSFAIIMSRTPKRHTELIPRRRRNNLRISMLSWLNYHKMFINNMTLNSELDFESNWTRRNMYSDISDSIISFSLKTNTCVTLWHPKLVINLRVSLSSDFWDGSLCCMCAFWMNFSVRCHTKLEDMFCDFLRIVVRSTVRCDSASDSWRFSLALHADNNSHAFEEFETSSFIWMLIPLFSFLFICCCAQSHCWMCPSRLTQPIWQNFLALFHSRTSFSAASPFMNSFSLQHGTWRLCCCLLKVGITAPGDWTAIWSKSGVGMFWTLLRTIVWITYTFCAFWSPPEKLFVRVLVPLGTSLW